MRALATSFAAAANRGKRRHPGYAAFVVHRLSGVALTLFLPLHFLALGLAIEGEATLDGFIAWTHNPWVKASEVLLVALLAAHLAGGVRLLAAESFANMPRASTVIIVTCAVSLATGLLFALNA